MQDSTNSRFLYAVAVLGTGRQELDREGGIWHCSVSRLILYHRIDRWDLLMSSGDRKHLFFLIMFWKLEADFV